MNNVLSIDTEFNNQKEILSLGLYSTDISEELYFKNRSNDSSLRVHGLITEFLMDSGQEYRFSSVKKFFDQKEYFLAYGIDHDLQCLSIPKKGSLYMTNKIIDLRVLIVALGMDGTLSDLQHTLGINMGQSQLIHSAYFDAKLTFKILEKIFSLSHFGNVNDFLLKASALTTATHLGNNWEMDDIIHEHFSFSVPSRKKIGEDTSSVQYVKKNGFVHVIKGKVCTHRFPTKYLSADIKFLNDSSDLLLPDIGIKFDNRLTKMRPGVKNG